jgi:hypothetical protein
VFGQLFTDGCRSFSVERMAHGRDSSGSSCGSVSAPASMSKKGLSHTPKGRTGEGFLESSSFSNLSKRFVCLEITQSFSCRSCVVSAAGLT